MGLLVAREETVRLRRQEIWLYVPADKQAIVTPVPAGDEATTAVLFLVGKGSITRDFTVSFAEGGEPDAYSRNPAETARARLRLAPGRRRSVDDVIRTLAADAQGTRQTFQLSNFKENVGLADKIFEFKPPRGTDVVYPGAPSR